MKKLLLVLAVLVSLGMKSYAEDLRGTPRGESDSIPADYGGVDIATNSFYVGLATVPSGVSGQGVNYSKFYVSTTTVNNVYAQTKWLVYGVNFSTGLCNPTAGPDFITIQASSGPASAAKEVTRFYNFVFISTMANGNVCGGIQYTRWPIRVYGNLFWGVNINAAAGVNPANPYNRADLLYYREPD